MKKQNLKLNELKVYKMILVHELCEVDTGDFTPYDKITHEEKYSLERKCMIRIAKECDMPEIIELWEEFEANNSPEAKFVKKLDKLDAVMQSKIYANQSNNESLFDEFYTYSKDKISEFDEFIDFGK